MWSHYLLERHILVANRNFTNYSHGVVVVFSIKVSHRYCGRLVRAETDPQMNDMCRTAVMGTAERVVNV